MEENRPQMSDGQKPNIIVGMRFWFGGLDRWRDAGDGDQRGRRSDAPTGKYNPFPLSVSSLIQAE